VVSFTARAFYLQRKDPRYSLSGWVGRRTDLNDVESRKILPISGLELWSLGGPHTADCAIVRNVHFDWKTWRPFETPGHRGLDIKTILIYLVNYLRMWKEFMRLRIESSVWLL
jgi:hypothetical protein